MLWPWVRKRKRTTQDWDEELKAHLAIEADQLRQNGMTLDEAEAAARRSFGNVTGLEEKIFEQGRSITFDNLLRDLQHALRLVGRNPGFSAIVIATLAVGIGASTAMFSLIDAVLLKPLPYKEPERLAMLWSANSAQGLKEGRVSLLNLADWREQNHSFEGLTFFGGQTFLLGTTGAPERMREARVPANFFPLVGVEPLLGRVFTADEERTGERVAILNYGLWQKYFGGSASVIGASVRMDGRVSKVIGVMPEHFQFPFADTQLWEPMTTHRYWLGNKTQPRSAGGWYVLGRLKSGVRWEQAQAEMDRIAKRLREKYPENEGVPGVSIVPLKVQALGAFRLSLTVLFCAVFVVLLMACINVASLLLARGSAREREFIVRRTLGAGSVRLAVQLLTETLLLALLGGTFGLLVAECGLKTMMAFGPQDIPRLHQARIDGRVLAYSLAVAVLAALLAGIGPALKMRVSTAVRSRTWSTLADRNLRGLLVIGEFAMALILCVGAGLLVHSFVRLRSVDRGFRPDHLLVMRIDLHVGRTAKQYAAYFQEAIETARGVPGVKSAAAIGRFLKSYPPDEIAIEGRAHDARTLQAADDLISGPYFETVGVALKAGRMLNGMDGPQSPMVAVINETMARRYWPNENAIGKRFSYPDPNSKTPPPWMTIVGVVGDMHRQGLEKAVAPQVFRPENQTPDNEMDLVVRTASDPASLAGAVREAVQATDKSVAKFSVATVEDALGEEGAERRFDTSLIGLFSLIPLFISGLGIYGLIHHSVVQRNHEIGVRMALGATRESILALVLGQALALSGAGVGAGLLGALALRRVLASLLYGVTPTDPITFISAVLLLLALAMVACWLPANRAIHIDASSALRQD